MTNQTLEPRIEICAYKPIEFYPNCSDCSGKEIRRCYTTSEDLTEHLKLTENLFHPRIRQFYLRFGVNWKQRLKQ